MEVIGLQRQQLLRAIEVLEAELQETKQQQQDQQQQVGRGRRLPVVHFCGPLIALVSSGPGLWQFWCR